MSKKTNNQLKTLSIVLTCVLLLFFTKASALVKNEKPLYNYPTFSLSLEEFYNQFDYSLPGLKNVKSAVDKKDYPKAGKELQKYFFKKRDYAQKIFKIKELTESQDKQTTAELLLKRTYSFQGTTYTFENGIDWIYNPTSEKGKELNPEWVVNTVRFRLMPTLSKAYRETKDERFATEAIYLMRDFIEKFPVPSNEKQDSSIPREIDWLVYSKLSTSARLDVTILGLFSVIESPNLKSEDFVIILQGIYNHLLRMEKYPYLSYHNMGVVDAQVLHKASLTFPEFKKSKQWTQWALERSLDQMDYVVYPDGVEKELCPRYHQGVMLTFRSFSEVAQDSGIPMPAKFTEKLRSMAEFLVKISRPDGSIPAFNEMVQVHGNGRDMRRRIRAMERSVNDNGVLKWFGSEGKTGTKPTYESVALDWSGYYVMRSGWDKNDNHMAIKAGPYGTAHQQEDKLSFEIFANGELFLIDPGFYIYNRESLWRKYYQSSLAHNTVIPDGLTQYRYGQRSLYENKQPNKALWISEKKYDFLSAVYNNGYADYKYIQAKNPDPLVKINHQRDILFIKPGVWLVLDWMAPEDSKDHLYESLFQSEFPITVSDNNLIVKGKKSNLLILPVSPKGKSLTSEVTSGQNEPFKRGWIYKKENVPIQTGVVSQKSSGKVVQAYFIIPEKDQSTALNEVNMIEVEGGIGAKLQTSSGLKLTFIAQQQAGKSINANGIKTSGRLKVLIENTKEIIEIN